MKCVALLPGVQAKATLVLVSGVEVSGVGVVRVPCVAVPADM
jgi:hypothetical protein